MKTTKTAKTLGLLSFSLLSIILLISVINAQTLVAGKIYTSGYNDIVSGADVHVVCSLYSLDTTSLDDGTYAVRFEETECGLGNNVNVNGVKADLSGSGSGVVIECNEQNDCLEGYVSIINLAIKSKPATENYNGGGGVRYYYCGNGKCDSGESITTCPGDCKIFINQNVTTAASQGTEEGNDEQNTTETLNQIPPETQTGFSRITGAVVGALGNLTLLIAIIFILIVLVLSISVRILRKRRANIEVI